MPQHLKATQHQHLKAVSAVTVTARPSQQHPGGVHGLRRLSGTSAAVGLGSCYPPPRRRPQHSAAQQGSETQQRDVQLRKDEDELSVWSLYMCIYLHNLHAGQA